MNNQCKGYIISDRFSDLTIKRTIEYKYKNETYKYDMNVELGNFVFNNQAIHPIQLELIIRNMYKNEMDKYKEFSSDSLVSNYGGLHSNEITQASFLASIGEPSVLYASKNMPDFSNIKTGNIMKLVRTLLVFLPKKMELISNSQMNRINKIIESYGLNKIDILAVCLSDYKVENNQHLEGFAALAFLTQLKDDYVGDKHATK